MKVESQEFLKSKNIKITNFNYLYRKIKELLRFYLINKSLYHNNSYFWKLITKEFMYLCLKFFNCDKYSFSLKNDQTKYSFGIFYILSFYFEFTEGFIIYIKEFLAYKKTSGLFTYFRTFFTFQ